MTAPSAAPVAPQSRATAPLLRVELPGLPKSMNQLMGAHWRVRAGHAKKWQQAVWAKAWPTRPREPLAQARLVCTRYSSASSMDDDNLRSSFKPLIDGLVRAGWLIDDGPRVIGTPDVRHGSAPPRGGHVTIEIFEHQPNEKKG
jgi:hypothetical protein